MGTHARGTDPDPHRGGFTTDADPEQMLGDVVQEITPDGRVVHEWRSWEHLSSDSVESPMRSDLEEDVICPLEGRREWTHGNSLKVTREGDLVVSYRQTSVVGIVDRSSGAPDAIGVGARGGLPPAPPRSNRGTGGGLATLESLRWTRPPTRSSGSTWGSPASPFTAIISAPIASGPNGNTLICEGVPGRLLEVTPNLGIAWEYINPFFHQAGGALGYTNGMFRAHRYGPDHPDPIGAGKDLDPGRYANLNRLYAAGRSRERPG